VGRRGSDLEGGVRKQKGVGGSILIEMHKWEEGGSFVGRKRLVLRTTAETTRKKKKKGQTRALLTNYHKAAGNNLCPS